MIVISVSWRVRWSAFHRPRHSEHLLGLKLHYMDELFGWKAVYNILKALYLREDFLQQVPKGKWRQKLWARAGLSEDLSTSTSSNTKGAYRHNPDYRSHSILEGLSTHNKSQGVSFDHARPTMTAGKRAVIPWYDHDLGMSVNIKLCCCCWFPLFWTMYKDPLFHLLFQALRTSQHCPNMAHLEDASIDVVGNNVMSRNPIHL
jgi:hypothetical protein